MTGANEIFTICTTCQTRLRVREESRIGEISSCPNCGSMVQIIPLETAPPEASQEEHASTGRTTILPPSRPPPTELDEMNNLLAGRALPKPASRAATGRSAGPAPRRAASREATALTKGAGTPSTLDPNNPPLSPANQAAGSAAPQAAAAGTEPPIATPDANAIPWTEDALVPAAGHDPSANPLIKRALVPLVIAIVVIAAILAYLLWLRSSGSSSNPSPVPSPESIEATSTADPPTNVPETSNRVPERASQADDLPATTPPVVAEEKPAESRPPQVVEPSPLKPDEEPAKSKPTPAAPAPTNPDVTVEKSQPALPGPPGLKPREASGDVSLGPAPVAGRFAKLIGGAAMSEAADVPTPAVSGNGPSRNPEKSPDGRDSRAATGGAANETPVNGAAEGGASDDLQHPEPRDLDVEARLGDRIAALSYDSVPLVDFIQLLSDLSTIPIHFDVDSLALRDLSPLTPVAVRLEKTTIAEALDTILKPQQLGFIRREGHLSIVPREALKPRPESRSYDVNDLVGKAPELAMNLIRWTKRLIEVEESKAADDSPGIRWEGGQLLVEHDAEVQLQVMKLCDQWRAARKIPLKYSFPKAVVEVGVNVDPISELLAKPLTLTFSQPTRWQVIIDRLGKSTGTKIVVNWPALAEKNWSPDMTATLTLDNNSLGDSLKKLLRPRELTYRCLDASLIEITTDSALAGRPEFRFHALPAAADEGRGTEVVAEAIRQLQGRLSAAGSLAADEHSPLIEWDATSRHLIVIASATQQQDVARWLKQPARDLTPAP